MGRVKNIEVSDALFKGRLTELQCLTYFTEKGYIVSIPEIPCPYDFLLDTGQKILRIQVKTSHPVKGVEGSIKFNTCSVTHNSKGYVSRLYQETDVDYFCTYWENQCYLIPFNECGTHNKRLRLIPTKNGQVKNITFAKDYIAEEVLSRDY